MNRVSIKRQCQFKNLPSMGITTESFHLVYPVFCNQETLDIHKSSFAQEQGFLHEMLCFSLVIQKDDGHYQFQFFFFLNKRKV